MFDITGKFCPRCNAPLVEVMSVTPDYRPNDGDIYVDGRCGFIGEFVEIGLRELTASDIDALDPETRRDIMFAVRNIGAMKDRIDNGEKI